MSAPVATPRGSPAGIMLKDGYSTKVTYDGNTTISFWEKTVTPSGYDGEDKIDQTTMFNLAFRTFAARSLVTLTDTKIKAAYDPNVFNQLLTVLNRPGTITVTWPDGSTIAFFGYIQKVEPAEVSEGSQPEMDITIVATNFDPVGKAEAAPVITSVAGT